MIISNFLFCFVVLILTSCVSPLPKHASIQDGIRCPTEKVAVKAGSPQRAPASITAKPTESNCEQLFSAEEEKPQ